MVHEFVGNVPRYTYNDYNILSKPNPPSSLLIVLRIQQND